MPRLVHRMNASDTDPIRILIADDQPDVVESLRLLFKAEGHRTESALSPAEALAAMADREFDLVLMDLNYARDTTSGQEGLDLLSRLQAMEAAPPIVVMTAWGTIDLAVEAMRRGARDFVQKPWENERLLSIVRTQTDLARALRHAARLEAENVLLRAAGAPPLIAGSEAMRPVRQLLARIGPSEANVLITGEHGTGKDVVARTLHALSPRSGKPLVTVNAGGLTDTVFDSELFGHVRGAFTDAKADRVGRFELADEGTLFLDEIANMPAAQQARLLRAIETGEFERLGSSRTIHVNVRLLSATNADINEEVRAGRFRADLLFRLNTVELRLPPLRERGEDIPVLADHFLTQHAARYGKQGLRLSAEAASALRAHDWPGNVRELDHVIERAVLMATQPAVRAADLGLGGGKEGSPRLEDMSLEDVEQLLIQKALDRFGGNVAEAARFLGLSRSGLYRRLQKHGLPRP